MANKNVWKKIHNVTILKYTLLPQFFFPNDMQDVYVPKNKVNLKTLTGF